MGQYHKLSEEQIEAIKPFIKFSGATTILVRLNVTDLNEPIPAVIEMSQFRYGFVYIGHYTNWKFRKEDIIQIEPDRPPANRRL